MNERASVLEILLFWAIIFFTCLVGLIEFLPELNNWNYYVSTRYCWIFQSSIALLYFGLLLGVVFSLYKFFNLYGLGYYGSPTLDLIQKYFKSYWVAYIILIVLILYIFTTFFIFRIQISAMG